MQEDRVRFVSREDGEEESACSGRVASQEPENKITSYTMVRVSKEKRE